jgi:hypothetical protein
MSLKNSETDQAYVYFIKAPYLSEDTDFTIYTNLNFDFEGKNFSKEHEHIISVKAESEPEIKTNVIVDTKGYVFEPLNFEFYVENNESDPIKNITIYFPESPLYNLQRTKLFFPQLFPGQNKTFKYSVLPVKQFEDIDNITLTFLTKGNNTFTKNLNATTNITSARTSFPNVEYTIEVVKGLVGEIKATVNITNPSDVVAKVFLENLEEDEIYFEVPAGQTVSNLYFLDDSYMIDRSDESFMRYEFLGRTYEIYPKSYSTRIQKKEQAQDQRQTDEPVREENKETISLDQQDRGSFIIPLVIVIILGLTAVALPVYFIIAHKRATHFDVDITEEYIDKIIQNHLEPSHVVKDVGDITSKDLESQKHKTKKEKSAPSKKDKTSKEAPNGSE